MKYTLLWLSGLLLLLSGARAQKSDMRFVNSGYIASMQTVMFQDFDGYWMSDNLLHNRLNMSLFPSQSFRADLQLRTRLLWGESFKYNADFVDGIDDDNGLLKLSHNVVQEAATILNVAADRFSVQYTAGNMEITLGRQRINWGRAFVWNPNDLFNNYSFFDFDYPEKPGTDALHLQYYTGAESAAELVVSANARDEYTIAALYRFNWKTYDFQLLGGMLQNEDANIGMGWAGDLLGLGFRGEMSYFHPISDAADTSGMFMVSISADKLFGNELHIMAEVLYANIEKPSVESFQQFYNKPLTVKNIAMVPLQIFAQASYPITPIWNASVSAMYYPKIKVVFTGPSVGYSISDNWEASVSGQYFSGEFPDASGVNAKQEFTYAFLRVKGSF